MSLDLVARRGFPKIYFGPEPFIRAQGAFARPMRTAPGLALVEDAPEDAVGDDLSLFLHDPKLRPGAVQKPEEGSGAPGRAEGLRLEGGYGLHVPGSHRPDHPARPRTAPVSRR